MFQKVSPIYENDAIKQVALSIIDEIKAEAPEILNSWVTVSLLAQLGEHSELTGKLTFYKQISRGTIYTATIFTNSEGLIRTWPGDGYITSQDIYYLEATGASVPNIFNFTCVWLNIVPPGCKVDNYKAAVPGVRYYQQVLNTSSLKNIEVNEVSLPISDSQAILYEPLQGLSIPIVDNNSINIGLICDNTERTIEDCISVKQWQLID